MNRLLLVAAFSLVLISAQTLTEAAISAAGGSAAGVAGKSVNEGIGKIFSKLSISKEEDSKAAKPAVKTTGGFAAPRPSSFAPIGTSIPSTGGSRDGADKSFRQRVAYQAPFAVTGPRAPSPEVLAGIVTGTAREDLIAKAGAPSCRIIMGEGAHVVELYNYAAEGETIASIRLTDGEVTNVRVTAGK